MCRRVISSSSSGPDKATLPYSAQVRLVEHGVYAVEPGATMRTDPQLQNSVIHTSSVPNLSQEQWEKAVLDYLTARQTFRKVVEDGLSDIGMILRIFYTSTLVSALSSTMPTLRGPMRR